MSNHALIETETMSPLIRHVLLTVTAILAAALFPAQSMAQTQAVTINFSIPFTLRNQHPSITQISSECVVRLGTTVLPVTPTGANSPKAITVFPKSADGTITGTYTWSAVVTVPADAGGKAGSYVCQLIGHDYTVSGVSNVRVLETNASDLRFRVQAPDSVTGTFVW